MALGTDANLSLHEELGPTSETLHFETSFSSAESRIGRGGWRQNTRCAVFFSIAIALGAVVGMVSFISLGAPNVRDTTFGSMPPSQGHGREQFLMKSFMLVGSAGMPVNSATVIHDSFGPPDGVTSARFPASNLDARGKSWKHEKTEAGVKKDLGLSWEPWSEQRKRVAAGRLQYIHLKIGLGIFGIALLAVHAGIGSAMGNILHDKLKDLSRRLRRGIDVRNARYLGDAELQSGISEDLAVVSSRSSLCVAGVFPAISTRTGGPSMMATTTEAPPVTLLGGFLGSGKTTALTHMLTNREGLKIAVLVNDVAAVNVDAATMRRRTVEIDGVDMVELQNGCVCCGPGAGELPPAVRSLLDQQNDDGSAKFDHVVVELSGVADPANVQKNLRMGRADVTRKVALVDANSFPTLYSSTSRMGDRTDLVGNGVESEDPCAVDRRVIELLLSQIETADVVLVNKCDLASADELSSTLAICRALNPQAKIISTTYGDAQLEETLPLRQLVTEKHECDQGNSCNRSCTAPSCADPACEDPSCKDPSCTDPSWQEDSHGQSPNHDQADCSNPSCTDPSCADPNCADRGEVPNSVESIGFQTYVFRARRPFSKDRLYSLAQRWPLPRKIMLSAEDIASPGADGIAADKTRSKDPTFANVLRSKGTVWIDSYHSTAAEWSHAGRHFTLSPGHIWWTVLPREIMRAALSSTGEDTAEESDAYKAELSHFAAPSADFDFGDRRQEIVFIGTSLDTDAIDRALNACLLTDEEMKQYAIVWSVEDERVAEVNGPFRFPVGTKVVCNCGEWMQGVVIKQYYREAEWPAGRWMPYQVQLDSGDLIYAPHDSDVVIRRG